MLEVKNLSVFYGPIEAVQDVSIKVKEGNIVTGIGPNGAGRTTMFSSIAGLLHRRGGQIRVFGEPDDGAGAERLVARGRPWCLRPASFLDK